MDSLACRMRLKKETSICSAMSLEPPVRPRRPMLLILLTGDSHFRERLPVTSKAGSAYPGRTNGTVQDMTRLR